MEPIPLAPKEDEKGNNDVSATLIEEFQEFLGEQPFYDNVAANIKKYHVEDIYVQNIANNVLYAKFKHETQKLNYSDIEEKLMYNKCHELICEDYIGDDPILKEKVQLNVVKIMPNIDARDVLRYGLITSNDLRFTEAEIATDARLQIINHDQYPCDEENAQTEVKRQKTPSPLPQTLKKEHSKCEQIRETVLPFRIVPQKLVFHDYDLNKTYRKRFVVQNLINVPVQFIVKTEPVTGYFALETTARTFKLSPGMTVSIIVNFRTDSYLDVTDSVTFRSDNGHIFVGTICCYRSAPNLRILINENDRVELPEYDIQRGIALNNTIDCGNCFLGARRRLDLNILNEGGSGEFFIITEEEWYEKTVAKMDRDMVLLSGPFKIYPCYFRLEEYDNVSIFIEFQPNDYGLQLETICFLCNNNVMEKIEIIGDGVLFEKNFFNVHGVKELDADKICSLPNGITHELDLGHLISYRGQNGCITVENNSCMDVRYEVKTLQKDESAIKSDWISVDSASIFKSYAEAAISFEICCKTFHFGAYSSILAIMAKDIPRKSLEPGKCFSTLRSIADSDELVDVAIARIHVKCFVIPCQIEVSPCCYSHPYPLKFGERINETVTITSNNSVPLMCAWDLKNEQHSIITPMQFLLEPYASVECSLQIDQFDYETVALNAELIVENEIHRQPFYFYTTYELPKCSLSPFLIDVGNVPINEQKTVPFYVENLAHVPVKWQIFEVAYDHTDQRFLLIRNRIEPCAGILNAFGDRDQLAYEVFTDVPNIWSSVLILLTEHKNKMIVNNPCFVNYKVFTPALQMYTDISDRSILFCSDVLHVNVTTVQKVYVRNVGFVSATFCWGKLSGSQRDSLNVTFSPQSCTIEPGICMNVDVHITPLRLGIVEDVHVLCHVDRLPDPLQLKIICLVDDIYFTVAVPNESGDYDVVNWPPTMINDYEKRNFYKRYYSDSGENEEMMQVPSAYSLIFQDSLTSMPKLPSQVSVQSGANSICSCEYDDDDSESSASVNRRRTDLSDFIEPNLALHEHIMQFENVPLRTVAKKTIFITNLTPLQGDLNVQVTQFYAKHLPRERVILGDVLHRAKQKKTSTVQNQNHTENIKFYINFVDEFDDCMNDDGFVIVPKPGDCRISANETVKIDVYVYGHTLGVYCGEVMIDVNDCLPFTFNVIAQIIGIPVEFPFAINTINPEPICRFDTVSCKSEKIFRNVKIRNTSTIPITIIWHTFLKEVESDEFPSHDYFNVIFDMYDPIKGCNVKNFEIIDGQLLLTDEFYGWRNERVFQVYPGEITIEPYQSTFFNIAFDPRAVDDDVANNVTGFVIGTIFISNCFIYKDHALRRWSGVDIIKLRLTANIEMPVLNVISDDHLLTANVCDFSLEDHSIRMETCVSLQNVSTCIVHFKTSIKYPFAIKTVQAGTNGKDKVGPEEILTVVVSLKLDYKEVLEMSEMFYNPNYKEEHYGNRDKERMSLTIKKNLVITYNVIFERRIPITLIIYYPKIEVDTTIVNFYMVYIGNVAKCQIILKNRCRQKVPFNIISSSKDVLVSPTCGTLKRNTCKQPEFVPVTITFKPTESRIYNVNVRIRTTIPKLYVDVAVQGTGTRDQNYQH